VPIFIYERDAISPFGHECDECDVCDEYDECDVCDVCDEIALHTHWVVDRLVVHDGLPDRVVHDKSVINAGFHEIIHCRMGFLRSLF
jgi:hypothetical protein